MDSTSIGGHDSETLDATLDQVAARVGFHNLRRYAAHARFILGDTPISESRVLDIGCGRGAHTLWAALHGASSVVALEPEGDGSTAGSAAVLADLIGALELGDRVELRRVGLEKFDGAGEFDVAIMDSVVNHLNEPAVVRLHRDPVAVAEYVGMLEHLRSLLRPGAFVIVADVGRRSIWRTIGRQGPWTHDIEWKKHQQPRTWIDVFRRAGLDIHDVRWLPLKGTGRLTGNAFVQYFTMAHFVLRFRAR
jgi:cyclopropane fatty-acyl-phospholipid synthase-like methyltransferase